QSGEKKHGGCGVPGRYPEADGQVLVNRENFVVVVRLNENVTDQNACDDRAEGKLEIGVIAQSEPFAGRSKKRTGTGFRRDQRGEHRPPRNLTPAQGKIFEIIFLS